MSHIVIHDNDEGTQYRQFDDVHDAATFLEELHNGGDVVGARLYALEPVEFAVRSYVKVEIGSPMTAPVDGPPAMAPPEPPESVEVLDDAGEYGRDERVDAVVTPFSEVVDEPVGGEVRRGLFGR